jgi:class 3 adenylate cyclase/tetratricopeptide (TPR) repeat protein
MDCPSCGRSNSDDARFCAACGAELGSVCPSCGTPVPPEARFCSSCGAPLALAPPGEERKLVTILFADVTGSTSLGEQLDPERMRDVLATFFQAMREEIEAEGGTVEKFIGDAVMAAFGVPAAHEDDPERALRAAFRMLDRLSAVNEELDAAFGVTLQIRIGANTGEVLAATDPRPGEPMVTGDVVNTAARLQSAADPGTILVSERTAQSVRGFRFDSHAPLELKGKAEPVRALVAAAAEPGAPERGIKGLQAPMVGRTRELDVLRALLESVSGERRPHLVTIYGEPGVGKSRLTREFLAWAGGREPPPVTLRGRCLPYGEGITYWPLAEILKGVAGVQDTDPPDVALAKVRESGRRLLGSVSDPARATAALAYTMGLEDPEVRISELEPKQVRAEAHGAWRAFFSSMAAAAPLVVVIEDIHWADSALLDLLEELAERVEGGVLFICPSRPELTSGRPTWGGGRRNFSAVALDPLTEQESEHLIRALLDIDDLPDHVRRQIVTRAEGNPFFLEEIIRQLIDSGIVSHEGGRWRAAEGAGAVVIPDTVQGVLAARIDLLDPPHKRVLQAAAVVGRTFWPGPVARLLNGEAGAMDGALAELEDRDLVRSRVASAVAGQPEFVFKHVLTRDVAYETLPRRERAGAHTAVGSWIEETVGDRVREFLELLAYHYLSAFGAARDDARARPDEVEPLRAKAFDYLLRASHDARSKLALRKAMRLGEQAIDLAAGPLELSLAKEAYADACFSAYRGDEAWRGFTAAVDAEVAAGATGDLLRVAYLSARAVEVPTRWPGSMRERLDEAAVRAYLDIGTAHLPPGDTVAGVRLGAVRSSWPFAFPDVEMSEEELESFESSGLAAAETAIRLGAYDLASAAFDQSAGAALRKGRYGRALRIEERRIPLAPHLGDPLELGDMYAMLAWCSAETGRWQEIVRYGREGMAAVAGRADNAGVHLLAWLTEGSFRLGSWDESLSSFATLRTMLEDRKDDPPYFALHAYAMAALIRTLRGEYSEAEHLTDLLRVLGGVTQTSRRVWSYTCRVLVARGELEEVRRRLADRPPGWELQAAPTLEASCELILALGAWGEAASTVEEARTMAEDCELHGVALFADRLEGAAALATGDEGRGREILARARDTFAEWGARWEAARTDLVAAELGGGHELAPGRLAEAEAVFEDLGSVEEIRRTRALSRG